MTANENQGLSAPVPDPDADLTDLVVFADDEEQVATGPADVMHASSAAYDDETDLAVAAPEPSLDTAFTPFGGSVPPPPAHPAYDLERDTGV